MPLIHPSLYESGQHSTLITGIHVVPASTGPVGQDMCFSKQSFPYRNGMPGVLTAIFISVISFPEIVLSGCIPFEKARYGVLEG
jgi:hypothetical protein